MIGALLLAAAAAQPVAEAERAFAAAAQRDGQWTAFRAFMAPDAIRLAPDPKPAAEVLAGLADPPRAVEWRPARTVTACDGSLAFSTGPWRVGAAGGRYFSIWQRQPDGRWKWLFDGGAVDSAGAAQPFDGATEELRADCSRPAPPASVPPTAGGLAADGTLHWALTPGTGGHLLRVRYWRRSGWATAAEAIVGG